MGSRAQRGEQVGVVIGDGQHDDLRLRKPGGDLPGRGEAVAWHPDVKQADIRSLPHRGLDGSRRHPPPKRTRRTAGPVPAPAVYRPGWVRGHRRSAPGAISCPCSQRDLHLAAVARHRRDDQFGADRAGTLPHRGKAEPAARVTGVEAVPLVADPQPHPGRRHVPA